MAGMTGRACGCGYVVEPSENLGANLAREGNVEGIGQPLIRMTVEYDAIAEGRL